MSGINWLNHTNSNLTGIRFGEIFSGLKLDVMRSHFLSGGTFTHLVKFFILNTLRRGQEILLYHFKSGFAIFKKLEPEMAEYIFNKLKELATK